MKKRIPKWQKKLTASERRHLRSMGITSLHAMEDNARHQKEQREKYSKEGDMFVWEPCWTCKSIARKLELPV